jgi:hypothetical protein
MPSVPPIPVDLWGQIPPAAQAAVLALVQQYEQRLQAPDEYQRMAVLDALHDVQSKKLALYVGLPDKTILARSASEVSLSLACASG